MSTLRNIGYGALANLLLVRSIGPYAKSYDIGPVAAPPAKKERSDRFLYVLAALKDAEKAMEEGIIAKAEDIYSSVADSVNARMEEAGTLEEVHQLRDYLKRAYTGLGVIAVKLDDTRKVKEMHDKIGKINLDSRIDRFAPYTASSKLGKGD